MLTYEEIRKLDDVLQLALKHPDKLSLGDPKLAGSFHSARLLMDELSEELDRRRPVPTKVKISGMYDMHLFHTYSGGTVDEVIANWVKHISKPIPAVVDGTEVDDLGVTSLCPAIVMCGDKELRRVGKMIFADYKTRKPRSEDEVEGYAKTLKEDPDIPRLLFESAKKLSFI